MVPWDMVLFFRMGSVILGEHGPHGRSLRVDPCPPKGARFHLGLPGVKTDNLLAFQAKALPPEIEHRTVGSNVFQAQLRRHLAAFGQDLVVDDQGPLGRGI